MSVIAFGCGRHAQTGGPRGQPVGRSRAAGEARDELAGGEDEQRGDALVLGVAAE